MTRKQLIYDIKRLLTKAGITDDSRLSNEHLGFLIDQRRAKEIRDNFKRNNVIEPIWLQDYGIFELTPVNKAEDRSIAVCDCKFSKFVLPTVVSISDPLSNTPDIGTYSIRSVCGMYEFHYANIQKLSLMTEGSITQKFRHFTKVGNAIYLTPEVKFARAILILDNPLDGYVLDNSYITSGNIVSGTTYLVTSGNITYNGTKYYVSQTFVGTSTTTFTGSGKVQKNTQKRQMTNDDVYPMSLTMAEVIKLKILTQDFQIEHSQATESVNNSSDDQRQSPQG